MGGGAAGARHAQGVRACIAARYREEMGAPGHLVLWRPSLDQPSCGVRLAVKRTVVTVIYSNARLCARLAARRVVAGTAS
jgi:hypothetical protein